MSSRSKLKKRQWPDLRLPTGDFMVAEPYKKLLERLSANIPQARLITDPLRTLAYGTDASFYRLVPKLIVKVEDESETLAVITACRELDFALTYRAAGTSLSGQALSEAVLVVLGPEGWRNYRISEDHSEITLGAGILGAEANRYLAPFGKKIGPDPASINSAKIGGIMPAVWPAVSRATAWAPSAACALSFATVRFWTRGMKKAAVPFCRKKKIWSIRYRPWHGRLKTIRRSSSVSVASMK
jgi:hypothetical protein